MRFLLSITCLLICICTSACDRSEEIPVTKETKKAESEPELNPKFPIVEGKYQMTEDWSISLPGKFNRRFEDGSLVIWRPGITAWIVIWGNDDKESAQERLKAIRTDIDPAAFDFEEKADGSILRFAYRLNEKRDGAVVYALYSFAFSETGHVQMAVYFDSESDLETAKSMWKGLGN